MEKRFLFIARLTLVFIFLVIVAGSVVRMSGSGMGCPDWPTCFGKWIPPTDSTALPENYREIYSGKRAERLMDFCDLLDKIGMYETADQMRNDPSLLEEEPFNAGKTWTEYVNRLIGFIAGNLVLLQFIFSFWWFRRKKKVFYYSLLNLLLISFTAWFGAIVVATNLLPWTITFHMGLALWIVLIQVFIIYLIENPKYRYEVSLSYIWVLRFALLLMIVQIIMGTQVRQQIDYIASMYGEQARGEWVSHLDPLFLVHRSFSLLILVLHGWLFYRNWSRTSGINKINLLFVLVILVAAAGAGLSYLGMPKIIQPVHLVLSSLILALQYHVLLRLRKKREYL